MLENSTVSTNWLAEHLHDDKLRIVDIRGHVIPASEPAPHYFAHHEDYASAHIPNAIFVDWTSDIVEPNTVSYDILNPQDYAALMSRMGIGNEHFVIAYDDASGMFAARLWWTMLYYGHEQVAVLDGGWQKWQQEGHPTTSETPNFPQTTFTVQENTSVFASADEIAAGVAQLVDVRSPAEFNGQSSRAKRKGHIPNALNIPRSELVTSSGILKSPEELRKIFGDMGITEQSSDVVLYCNGGVSASYGLLALKAAGVKNGRVYDGSWKDWGNNPERPIE